MNALFYHNIAPFAIVFAQFIGKQSYFRSLMTFAGHPTATEYGGMGFTTTEPAPMTEPSPMSPEYIMLTPIPI